MTQTNENRTERQQEEAQEGQETKSSPGSNPTTGPGPRGNQDIDPGRVENVEEDLDRAGAN